MVVPALALSSSSFHSKKSLQRQRQRRKIDVSVDIPTLTLTITLTLVLALTLTNPKLNPNSPAYQQGLLLFYFVSCLLSFLLFGLGSFWSLGLRLGRLGTAHTQLPENFSTLITGKMLPVKRLPNPNP